MTAEPPAQDKEKAFRSGFSRRRILLPILIGLLAAGWLLVRDLRAPRFEPAPDGHGGFTWNDANGNGIVDPSDPADFSSTADGSGDFRRLTARDALTSVEWTWYSTGWLLLALLFTAFRDLGYIVRIRILTSKQLGWRSSFNAVMLWEFACNLAPSVVGGTAFAAFILQREGIALGRSTAIVLVTAMLDELFYIITVPLVFAFVGMAALFPPHLDEAFGGLNMMVVFWIGYAVIVAMTLAVWYAVFFRPRAIKHWTLKLFQWKPLRRWRQDIAATGHDLVLASADLKERPVSYWAKGFAATVWGWASRFLVVNCLAAAFFPVSDHMLLYARQLVMWVILLISPTPGASGFAELAFAGFFKDLLPALGLIGAVALVWRMLTYYLYVVIGVIILPRWLRRTAKPSA